MKSHFIIITTLIFVQSIVGRSHFRASDPSMPEITTQWTDGDERFHLKSYYLEEEAVFKKFDKMHVLQHILPAEEIPFRYDPEKKVSGELLTILAEELLVEIQQHKKKFKDFTIVKKDDFNPRTSSGSLILKYKDYPFMLKVFMETPRTFVRPFSKGMINSVFVIMGGGANRYMSGFLRIKNLEAARALIEDSPYWKDRVDFPRKWFILPSTVRWFYVIGNNIGPSGTELVIELPSVYMVITDWISFDKPFSLFNRKHRKIATSLANYLGNRIDAHIDNFVEEKIPTDSPVKKETKSAQNSRAVHRENSKISSSKIPEIEQKIVLIDTEHFPTLLGIKKPLYFQSYTSWYTQITAKCFEDCFLTSKRKRTSYQQFPKPVIMPC